MSRRSSREMSPGAAIFFGIVMVVIAVVMFRIGSTTKNMHKRCTQATNGVVQSVREERRTRKSGKHSRRVTYYVYVTQYEFDVDGKEYTGKSTLSSSERLSVGATLNVHYNSADPAKDHYTDYDDNGTGGIFFAVFMGLFGLVFTSAGIKKKLTGGVGVRQAVVGAALASSNNNNFSNSYNNNYNNSNNNFNNSYNNNSFNGSFNNSGSNNGVYSSSGFNNSYNNNNYNNNGYNNNGYNNGYNNNYNNGNNNDFNQLN